MTLLTVDVGALDAEGRGVARVEGKAVFVEGGLPGERVVIETLKRKPTWELARATRVERASADRVVPRCPHFGTCGGCTLQHATPSLQVAAKQRALEDALERIGHVKPALLLPPVYGPAWGYRTRARLSVRQVVKKGGVLVGFHERKSSYVADMRECHVLPPSISALLVPLRELVGSLTIRDRLPQIELAIGARADDPSTELAVLVLRVIEEPTSEDLAKLDAFADAHGVSLWLQPGGPGSATPMRRGEPGLVYTIPEFDVVMPFSYFFRSASRFRSASSRALRAAATLRTEVSTLRAAARTSTTRFCLTIARLVRDSSTSVLAIAALLRAARLKSGMLRERPTDQAGNSRPRIW